MDYNRLFYMNITYKCNNHCVYCISHNTKNRTRKVGDVLKIIQSVHNKFTFSSSDLFVVNGGEPTTSPYFPAILDYLLQAGINIIVYTNGRTLSQYRLYTENQKIRWIVPFYGLQKIHDLYTRQENSFTETFESLKSVTNKENIRIKFLIEDEKQLADFKILSESLKGFGEIHISLILGNNLKKRFALGKRVSLLIRELLEKHTVKLSNLPLCALLSEEKLFIEKRIKDLTENRISAYYFVDENSGCKEINYDKNHNWLKKCGACKMRSICCDNYKKYRTLKICKNEINLEEE